MVFHRPAKNNYKENMFEENSRAQKSGKNAGLEEHLLKQRLEELERTLETLSKTKKLKKNIYLKKKKKKKKKKLRNPYIIPRNT